MNTKPSFIIVGGGMAGAFAAQTLREEVSTGRSLCSVRSRMLPMSALPVQGLSPRQSRPGQHLRPPRALVRRARSGLVSGHSSDLARSGLADRQHRDRRTAELRQAADSNRFETAPPWVPGADLDGLYYLRNVEDSERLKIEFAQAKRVVIIGAGWIGLETAAAARAAGLDVTLLVSGDMPLEHVLGPEVAPIFAELHRSHGVDLRYRTTAVELTGRHGRRPVSCSATGLESTPT